jgi:hypothetical protein
MIINVSGVLAFSGPAPIDKLSLRRAVYMGTLARFIAPMEWLLHLSNPLFSQRRSLSHLSHTLVYY